MIVEYTVSSEPTHGEDDRPSGGRGVDDVLSRPAVRMEEHDRYRLAGGCGIRISKSSISSEASSQVSQDMASQEFNSNTIESCLTPEDARANRGVSPWYARCEVSKPNIFMILHPAIGNLRKQSIELHPSVGSFKRGRKE